MSAAPDDPKSAEDRSLAKAAKIGVPVAIVVSALIVGALQGPAMTILVLAGGALLGVIATFWSSLRTLAGETRLEAADAYALGAPRAEEEQKRAVIRALKDLEFEHSVGKISDEDFDELTAKYREEAKRLLRHLDAESQPRRLEVEELVERRLRREGLIEAPEAVADTSKARSSKAASPSEAPVGPSSSKAKKRKKRTRAEEVEETTAAPEAAASEGIACTGCGTRNDVDAVFCKKCGKKCGEEPTEAGRVKVDERTGDTKQAPAEARAGDTKQEEGA